jgi:SAM-dependent methyltransferase
MKGFPGRELSLDPGRSRFERMYANLLGAPANGLRIRLRRVLPATRGSYQTILDAGCGSGVFSFELAKQHPEAQVTGVELEPDLVGRANQMARRAGLTNVRFEQGDVTKLDFEDAFDLVVSVDNFEHVEDDVTAMRTLRSALHVRPGYRADQLVARLREAGFEVTSHQYTYGAIETFTNNLSYLITGADQRRKLQYAAVFPVLLAVSYLGKFSRPRWGAGVLATARRPVTDT